MFCPCSDTASKGLTYGAIKPDSYYSPPPALGPSNLFTVPRRVREGRPRAGEPDKRRPFICSWSGCGYVLVFMSGHVSVRAGRVGGYDDLMA